MCIFYLGLFIYLIRRGEHGKTGEQNEEIRNDLTELQGALTSSLSPTSIIIQAQENKIKIELKHHSTTLA